MHARCFLQRLRLFQAQVLGTKGWYTLQSYWSSGGTGENKAVLNGSEASTTDVHANGMSMQRDGGYGGLAGGGVNPFQVAMAGNKSSGGAEGGWGGDDWTASSSGYQDSWHERSAEKSSSTKKDSWDGGAADWSSEDWGVSPKKSVAVATPLKSDSKSSPTPAANGRLDKKENKANAEDDWEKWLNE